MYNKKYIYKYPSGTDALIHSLIRLKSKRVLIPTYTCADLATAVQLAGCEMFISDCDLNLQIDIHSSKELLSMYDIDTIIIPHMFGIQANIKHIKLTFPEILIIEDCSQAHGLPDMGMYSDIVITSINKGKWLSSVNHFGLMYTNYYINNMDMSDNKEIIDLHDTITNKIKIRQERARELQHASVNLIGTDRPNVFLRGMYFTESQRRIPYIPLHNIYNNIKQFNCPIVDSFKNKIDWISIYA